MHEYLQDKTYKYSHTILKELRSLWLEQTTQKSYGGNI